MQELIRYTQGRSSLGDLLVAASAAGLVMVEFGDGAALTKALRLRFPDAELVEDQPGLAGAVEALLSLIEHPPRDCTLALDLRGSDFEVRVWQQLRQIPTGQTSSYGAIAAQLGAPRMAREVGEACAANVLAVVVPCHRVLKKDGALSGYRWGVARKRALLQREAPQPFAQAVPR